MEEDNTPLSVTVTPCDAPLEWRLTLQELPEEASGEASGNRSQVWMVRLTLRVHKFNPKNDRFQTQNKICAILLDLRSIFKCLTAGLKACSTDAP